MWEIVANLVPLAQTILWIGLIIWVLKRYRDSVDQLIALLKKRIDAGSSVKAGPFELGESVKPVAIKHQRLETENDIDDYLNDDADGEDIEEGKGRKKLRSEYYQAEDLVFRELQEEFNVAIQRNVRVDSEFTVDGMFVKYSMVYFIEVKIVTGTNFHRIAKRTLQDLDNDVRRQNLSNAVILLALVYLEEAPASRIATHELIDSSGIETESKVVIYEAHELKKKFGLN